MPYQVGADQLEYDDPTVVDMVDLELACWCVGGDKNRAWCTSLGLPGRQQHNPGRLTVVPGRGTPPAKTVSRSGVGTLLQEFTAVKVLGSNSPL